MQFETYSQQGTQKLPSTAVYHLLDGQLLIFLRSWGSQDYNQKFIDEVMHYLSTAQADIEVTSPFDMLENLTSLANKVRISLLLAHDYFYKVENKASFSIGFETAVLIKNKKEISWGTVGRFNIYKVSKKNCLLLSAQGTDQDEKVLLPVELLGVEKDLNLRCGAFILSEDEIILSSSYGEEIKIVQNQESKAWSAGTENQNATYWFSKVKSE